MSEEGQFWRGKKVFVTGGTGLIGSYLVKGLVDKGAEVFCLTQELPKGCIFYEFELEKKTTSIFGSVNDKILIETSLEKYDINTVFHLAAQPLVQIALKKPYGTIYTNVIGTLNILEACRNNEGIKRIVIASSDKAYGSHDNLPYDESFALKGDYPYDVSKSCADLIAQSYGKTYGMPIGVTRFSNVYGGGDLNFDRIVPETIKHLILNEPILIRSDGQFSREFFYVKDAARAYIKLAEKIEELGIKGEGFNFGTDKSVKMLDLVDKIKRVSGKENTKIKILNIVKAEIKEQFLSSEKARKVLHWKPEYDLERGLKETYAWYERYFENEKYEK